MSEPSIKADGAAASVARRIETLVLEGSLRPGEQLLPERELAERLGVSRPTLREGIRLLKEAGVLIGEPGSAPRIAALGTSFTDPLARLLSMQPDSSVFNYLEFRALVEPSLAALAAQRATAVDLEVIRGCLARIEQAHEEQTPSGEADADLHIAIYEAAHNITLLHVMRSLSGMLRSSVFYSRTRLHERPELREILLEQHRTIAQALLNRDGPQAQQAVAQHIAFTAQALREIIEADSRLKVSLRRLERGALAAKNP